MAQKRVPRGAALAATALALIAAGCGGSSDASAEMQLTPAQTPTVRCISRAGARIAQSADDLQFFFDAQEQGAAEHPSTIFTNSWTVAVARWKNVPGTPDLRVWAAQRLHSGDLSTVRKLVTEWPRGAYVAYLRGRHPRVVQAVEDCLSAVYGPNGAPVK